MRGDLEWLMHRQGGVFSRRQALKFLSVAVVRRRVSSGRWQAPHRGIIVAHNGPLSPVQCQWVAVLAAGAGRPAYLGGLSALLVLGLKTLTSRHIHVLLPARCRETDPPAGVVVHRTRSLPPVDRWRAGSPPCTTAPRSVVDAAQWAASDSEARVIVAAAFQQRLVRGDDIEIVAARMPRAFRRSLILRTAADARGGSGTITEIDLLDLCRRAGLPLPTRQVRRVDASGRERYLDAWWEEWKLHVEVDGAHHMNVEHWWADMSRQNELWIPGERVLRFPAWLVRERPHEVIAQIRAALMAAGWVPGR
jgi:hypothetical protein